MGRGRKVNSNGERSMKLLREKAIEIFSEKGYFQTKISDIVKAADVTQPTFYLYFESKEVLYKDILVEFQTNLEKIFDETFNEYEHLKNSKRTIGEILNRLFTYFTLNANLTKIGMNKSDVPFANEILPQKFQRILEENPQYLQNEFVTKQTFIQSLIGSVERLTLSELLTKNMEPEQLAEEVVNIYFSKKVAEASI